MPTRPGPGPRSAFSMKADPPPRNRGAHRSYLWVMLLGIFAPAGCTGRDGKVAPEEAVKAFVRFEKTLEIPAYGAAFDENPIDLPGCSKGVVFKIKAGFRSDSAVRFYSDFFRSIGLVANPALSLGDGEWATVPISDGVLPPGSRQLYSQKAFMTNDRTVSCTVTAFYQVMEDGGSDGRIRALDSSQSVGVYCGPNLPPKRNPCLGRTVP